MAPPKRCPHGRSPCLAGRSDDFLPTTDCLPCRDENFCASRNLKFACCILGKVIGRAPFARRCKLSICLTQRIVSGFGHCLFPSTGTFALFRPVCARVSCKGSAGKTGFWNGQCTSGGTKSCSMSAHCHTNFGLHDKPLQLENK